MDADGDRRRLDDRVALVTGANGPIGAAIATTLVAHGARVLLGVHRPTWWLDLPVEANRLQYLNGGLAIPGVQRSFYGIHSLRCQGAQSVLVTSQIFIAVGIVNTFHG